MKIQTIKRPNGLWVAYEAGKKLMAQAKKKSWAIAMYAAQQFNIKD